MMSGRCLCLQTTSHHKKEGICTEEHFMKKLTLYLALSLILSVFSVFFLSDISSYDFSHRIVFSEIAGILLFVSSILLISLTKEAESIHPLLANAIHACSMLMTLGSSVCLLVLIPSIVGTYMSIMTNESAFVIACLLLVNLFSVNKLINNIQKKLVLA